MTPNFFTDQSPFLNHPLLTAERTSAEVDFVLSHAKDGPFLDVGCGFGRHSLELAKRGLDVVGIDPAEAMIAAANERKKELNEAQQDHATFVVSAGESFQTDHKFGTSICLMTTFGQVSASGPNDTLLSAIQQNLKPGGKLILEVPQKQTMVNNLKASDRFGTDTHYTQINRRFDSDLGQIIETFEIVSPESTHHFLLSYKLYDQAEIEAELQAAGFKIVSMAGTYSGEPVTDTSMNMVIVAEANG